MDLGIPGLTGASKIGQGGFAAVYKAYQPQFDRTVAVKVFGGLDIDDSTVRAYQRECRAIGKIGGRSNILAVYEAGLTASGHPFMIMPYMAAGSLADEIERAGAMPWQEVVDIGRQLTAALDVAHGAGVLHRDLKPANVLMTEDGEPRLADFGIARLVDASSRSVGAPAFTPAYAAPEILHGEEATAASDVYSLSCTLFTALAGRPAFVERPDDDVLTIISRVATSPLPDLLRPAGTPEAVRQVIERAMAKDPHDRPATAAEFGIELEAARIDLSEQPTLPAQDPTPVLPPNLVARRGRNARPKQVAVALAVLAVLGVGRAVLLANLSSRSSNSANRTAATSSLPTQSGSTTGSTGTTGTTGTQVSAAASSTTLPTIIAAGTALGTQLKPLSQVACTSPHFDTGSSWELGAVRVGGKSYASAYNCNMFPSGSGSIDFNLSNSYRLFTTTIGFSDNSQSTQQTVKFEVIGNGTIYVTGPRTLHFGDTMTLSVNVSGISRLTLRVTEVGGDVTDSSPSVPVWAAPGVST